jgi:hypothetical protein
VNSQVSWSNLKADPHHIGTNLAHSLPVEQPRSPHLAASSSLAPSRAHFEKSLSCYSPNTQPSTKLSLAGSVTTGHI